MAAAVTFALPAAGTAVWAATGTVTGSDINVRSEASSDSSQVGTVTTGDVVTVGETATDSSGATWYQVTLSNGTTGYVRGDFLTVDESSDETDAAADDASADASTEEDQSTDQAAADAAAAAEQDTGGYQVVLAPDENGTDTYYLYDNNAGQRMKISDIDKLQDDVTAANEQAASVKKTYTVLVIVLAAAAAILLIGVIVLVIKLRDVAANGRRERDLTMERRDQRRNDHRADSVESLRRPRGEQASRSGRGRDDAYSSLNTRRVERDGAGRDRDARRAPAADRRPVRPAAQQDGYAARPATRPAAPARDGEVRTARPAARPAAEAPARRAAEPARSVADGEAPVRRAARPAAPARDGEARTARPAARPAAEAPARRSAEAARPAAKNFADDDFDYDFLKLDDAD